VNEVSAIRTSCTVTSLAHVHALKLTGPGALDLLDAATTSRLFVRENQLLQTLMLDAQARIFADAFVGLDEDGWLLFAEGPTHDALLEHLDRVRRERAPAADVSIEDLRTGHELYGVDGPFSWELVSEVLGPEVLGAPYLSFLKLRDVTCVRAGKTGEYGYLLLLPKAQAAATVARLHELGAAEGSLELLDQCALENWHYSIRLTTAFPDELQLRWRIDPTKQFEGSDALRARTPARRATCFTAHGEPKPEVSLDGREIGSVIAARWSATRAEWVGWALLDSALAVPGLVFDGGLHTVSPPMLDNRSLFVDPRKHSLRGEQAFPPLVSR
jgi:aminomethyltransferase